MKYIISSILLLCMAVGIGIYLYFFVKRFAKSIKMPVEKKPVKICIIVIAVILTFLCVNIFSFIAIIMLHIVVISMLTDLVDYIIRKASHRKNSDKECRGCRRGQRIWTRIHRLGLIPIVVTTILMIYGYYNMNHVVRTDYTIYTDKSITIEEDGTYRVALIADLHYGVSINEEELKRICGEISEQKIDIVILCGDIADENTTKENMKAAFAALAEIESKYGSFYVYGNHDRQLYRSANARNYTEEELNEAIVSNGIKILQDDVYSINDEFTIIGREDMSYNSIKQREAIANLMKETEEEDFILVLDHQPKEYADNEAAGTDLLLSGHTHGGQILPANILFKIAGFDDAVYGMTEGDNNAFKAIVTSGIAGWGYPVKTAAPAEYVIIDITQKK